MGAYSGTEDIDGSVGKVSRGRGPEIGKVCRMGGREDVRAVAERAAGSAYTGLCADVKLFV